MTVSLFGEEVPKRNPTLMEDILAYKQGAVLALAGVPSLFRPGHIKSAFSIADALERSKVDAQAGVNGQRWEILDRPEISQSGLHQASLADWLGLRSSTLSL